MKDYIAGLGEILFDCLPDGKKLGGAPANFAYHASMFGYQAYAVSALGNDALGDRTVEELDKKHLRHIMPRIDFPTGTVQVELDEEGVPTYDISLAQRNSVSHDTIHRFLHSTPKDCLKIFDINLRQNFYTKEIIQESLNACDILKINDEELVTIGRLFGYPGLDMENKCYLILGKYNLRMLVLTCGTNGSYVFARGMKSYQPTPKVEVADTVGAGDSFTGSFAAAILAGMPVEEAHKLAVEVSAYVCTQPGAMPQLPERLLNRVG